MTSKFTTPCFIRKNTKELRDKLEELGYHISRDAHYYPILYCFEAEDNRGVMTTCADSTTPTLCSQLYGNYIDCGTNVELFLALAALKEGSDYMQWFYNEYYNEWNVCELDSMFDYFNLDWCIHTRKAIVEELIEYFKNK